MTTKFLVLELHHFGDAVMALPFLNAAAPYGVAVYCTKPVAQMLDVFAPRVHTIVAADTWWGRYGQAYFHLRRLRPQIAVSAWSDARTQILGWLSGASVRAGLPMNEKNYYASSEPSRRARLFIGKAMEQIAGALTTPVNRGSDRDSHTSNWQLLAEALDLPLRLDPPWLDASRFPLPKALSDFIITQRASGRRLWVIPVGGRLPEKRWPIERFQALLAGYFQKTGDAVLIVHQPGEDAPTAIGDRQRTFACDSHEDLAAILNAADFVLSNDSYPAHLAAALGKKTFTIFGSGDSAIFAPYDNEARTIQKGCSRHSAGHRSLTPCAACLFSVSVEDVEKILPPS